MLLRIAVAHKTRTHLSHSLEDTHGRLCIAVEDGADGHPAEIGLARTSQPRPEPCATVLPDANANVNGLLGSDRARASRAASSWPIRRVWDTGTNQFRATQAKHHSHTQSGPIVAEAAALIKANPVLEGPEPIRTGLFAPMRSLL